MQVLQVRTNNYLFLLAGLVALILLAPIAIELNPGSRLGLLRFAFLFMLLNAVWSLAGSKQWYVFGWMLTGVSLFSALAYKITEVPILDVVLNANLALFCILSCSIALKDVFGCREISLNRVVGSVCAQSPWSRAQRHSV